MRKILIILLIIIIIIFLLIINLVNKGDEDKYLPIQNLKKNIGEKLKYDKINDIYYYYGNRTYFIVEFELDKRIWYAILDEKENIIDSIKDENLYSISSLKDRYKDNVFELSLGYKDDFIYEIKVENKKEYIYHYYSAIDGKKIEKINIKK